MAHARTLAGLPLRPVPDFPEEEVSAEFRSMVERGRWPGYVACAFTGEGQLSQCAMLSEYGKCDLRRGRPMRADTIVRLYSMTKAFVAAGVLRLAERGQLRLDDPADKHLPEHLGDALRQLRVAKEEEDCDAAERVQGRITIRHLLSHTSGLGSDIGTGLDALTRKRDRWSGMYKGLTSAVDDGQIQDIGGFVAKLVQLPLWQHPGREFYYSYGYDILGYILEVKSGLRLDAFLKREIFGPLGMKDTGFAVPRAKARRLAPLYRHTKAKAFGADGRCPELREVESRFVAPRHCPVLSGGGCVSSRDGGLVSTMRDYAKFLVCVFNRGQVPGSQARLLSEASARLMLQNQCAVVGGCKRGQPQICAHNRKGVGLCLVGEVQLEGCEPDDGKQWFDGVPGLVQWGGAATTFYKYQVVNGKPLLLIVFTQVLPQDDGRSCSAAFEAVRSWAASLPARKRRRVDCAA